MSEREGDFIFIASSDLISEVMGEFFNKKMFKKKVEIVDVSSSEEGYVFSLALVKERKEEDWDTTFAKAQPLSTNGTKKRDRKGRFVKGESHASS